jgi:M6 family metalloprotease-like protein
MSLIGSNQFYFEKYFNQAHGATSVVNYFRDMSGGRNIFVPANTTNTIGNGGRFFTNIPSTMWSMPNASWANNGVDVTISPSTHQGVIRIRIHRSHPITSWNGSNAVWDNACAIVSIALRAIFQRTSFNFNSIENGNNLHVGAVIAGGDASGGFNPGGQVWGHAWSFNSAIIGRNVGWQRYMAYGERLNTNDLMGIGISVHELGHTLGLPDLYDYTGESQGVGPYCLMAGGSWGQSSFNDVPGNTPTALSAWAKMALGYVNPIVVPADSSWSGNLHVNNAPLGGPAYNMLRINHPADHRQYFLVENRNINTRWDAGLWRWAPNPHQFGGIMIYHVDESMQSHGPNDNWRRKLVDVEEADGFNLTTGRSFLDHSSTGSWWNTDHFFRSDSHNLFSPTTNPNSNFYEPRNSIHNNQQTGNQNVVTNITVRVNSPRALSMQVVTGVPALTAVVNPVGVTFSGGNSTVNATAAPGTSFTPSNMRFAAFLNDSGNPVSIVTPTGNTTNVSATLNFPQNNSHFNQIYTIRFSLNGGANWHSTWNTVTVRTQGPVFTPSAPNAWAHVTHGLGGRFPITIRNTANGARRVTIRGTMGQTDECDPALFDSNGVLLAYQNYNNWNFIRSFILLAGQEWRGFLGTGGNVANNYWVTTTWDTVTTILGDVNGDFVVTSADVVLLRRVLAGHPGVTLVNPRAGDVNCDGSLTSADVVLLRRFLAGHPVTLGCNKLTCDVCTP